MTQQTDALLAAGFGKHTMADLAGIGPFVSVPATALAAELVRSDEDEESATIQTPDATVPAFGERVTWDTLRSLITYKDEVGEVEYVAAAEYMAAALDHEQAKATAYGNTLNKVRAYIESLGVGSTDSGAILDILERCEQDF